jgi:hypothetical protein
MYLKIRSFEKIFDFGERKKEPRTKFQERKKKSRSEKIYFASAFLFNFIVLIAVEGRGLFMLREVGDYAHGE